MKTLNVPAFQSSTAPIWQDLMNIADWGAGGIIVFAGAYWMLGHRGPAIQHLVNCGIGYLIIHHSRDMLQFLQSL